MQLVLENDFFEVEDEDGVPISGKFPWRNITTVRDFRLQQKKLQSLAPKKAFQPTKKHCLIWTKIVETTSKKDVTVDPVQNDAPKFFAATDAAVQKKSSHTKTSKKPISPPKQADKPSKKIKNEKTKAAKKRTSLNKQISKDKNISKNSHILKQPQKAKRKRNYTAMKATETSDRFTIPAEHCRKMTKKMQKKLEHKLNKLDIPKSNLISLVAHFVPSKNKNLNEMLFFHPEAHLLTMQAIRNIDELITESTTFPQVRTFFLSSLEALERAKQPVWRAPKNNFSQLKKAFNKI